MQRKIRATTFVLRALGVANVAFAVLGSYLLLSTATRIAHSPFVANHRAPYTVLFFKIFSVANAAFVLWLVVAGVYLIRLNPKGVTLSVWLFAVEISYFISTTLTDLFVRSDVALSIAAAAGIGNEGIAPQVVTFYPVIALVALFALSKRWAKARLYT